MVKSGYPPRVAFDSFRADGIDSNVTHVSTTVRLRLTATQMTILWPGLDLLANSHARRLSGGIRYEYPFRMYPPPAGFDRGLFVQDMMDKVVSLWKILHDRKTSGGRVQMDTFHLRAAAFAVRAYIDFIRLQRYQSRRQSPRTKTLLPIDDHSFQLLKAKSKAVILFLERHMKRANKALQQAVTGDQYHALMADWIGHLRWMRLHIAYFKPLVRPILGRRIRQQRDLDELMRMAQHGLRNAGFQAPEGKELRRIMRLFARSVRRGREGFSLPSLLNHPNNFNNTRYLAQFVLQRLSLRRLSES